MEESVDECENDCLHDFAICEQETDHDCGDEVFLAECELDCDNMVADGEIEEEEHEECVEVWCAEHQADCYADRDLACFEDRDICIVECEV